MSREGRTAGHQRGFQRRLNLEALEDRTLPSLVSPGFYDTGKGPYGVAVADLRGNGVSDLVTANYGTNGGGNTVSVLLGNGDGSFQAPVSYPVVAGPGNLVVADLNGDGVPDLVTGGTTSVLLGRGDGTFAPAVSYEVGREPSLGRASSPWRWPTSPATGNWISSTVSIRPASRW